MESLSDEVWDLLIAGTSLPQSLLALSLSRSNLKILHVDQNQYYGGTDAGLSLDEAEKWAELPQVKTHRATTVVRSSSPDRLAASRAYTLNLNPQIIYASSSFLPSIVTSRLHDQLDFLAVGSWWMLKDDTLQRIPSTREDVFADDVLPQRDKFRLMKFLRYVLQEHGAAAETEFDIREDATLDDALSAKFRIPASLHKPLAALALIQEPPGRARFENVVHRVQRHMKSMNHFGPGFAAVYPKYAGNAEIAQVACRAGAVGGTIYLLGQGVVSIAQPPDDTQPLSVRLTNGTIVKAKKIVGSEQDLPSDVISSFTQNGGLENHRASQLNSISVVSSSLNHLFPPTSDSGPIPAVAIVCVDDGVSASEGSIYLQVHSEDTGECPAGQCCIYASITIQKDEYESATERLGSAVKSILSTASGVTSNETTRTNTDAPPTILWSMMYLSQGFESNGNPSTSFLETMAGKILAFPARALDIAFDDSILTSVKAIWRKIVGEEADGDEFLVLEERQKHAEQ